MDNILLQRRQFTEEPLVLEHSTKGVHRNVTGQAGNSKASWSEAFRQQVEATKRHLAASELICRPLSSNGVRWALQGTWVGVVVSNPTILRGLLMVMMVWGEVIRTLDEIRQ